MKEMKVYNPIQESQYTCLLPNEEDTEQLKASRNEWSDGDGSSTEGSESQNSEGHQSAEETLSDYVKQSRQHCLIRVCRYHKLAG